MDGFASNGHGVGDLWHGVFDVSWTGLIVWRRGCTSVVSGYHHRRNKHYK